MATNYESSLGHMFYNGRKFFCPCGVDAFRVEIGSTPTRFWCDCGAMYTEYIVASLNQEREEVAQNGV